MNFNQLMEFEKIIKKISKCVYYKESMFKILAIIVMGIFIISCNDVDPNESINPDYQSKNRYGNFETDTLYAVQDSVIHRDDPIVDANKVSVGKFGDFSAAFIIGFSDASLPDSGTTSQGVDSVKLEFFTLNNFGASRNMQISIYRVEDTWSLNANQDSSWKDPVNKIEFIGNGNLDYRKDSTTVINLPQEVFEDWGSVFPSALELYISAAENDNGNIIELASSSHSTAFPILTYFYQDSLDTVAVSKTAALSTTIFNYSGTALDREDNKILISSGEITNSLLQFDFSNLPADAIYYSADLKLYLDDYSVYENGSNDSLFTIYAVRDIEEDNILVSPNNNFILYRNGSSTGFNSFARDFASSFIQSLKNNDFENKWLLLRFFREDREISVLRFFGANAAQQNLRPRLVVKYLLDDNKEN